MNTQWIKNRAVVGISPERQIVLDIIEAGLDSIDTQKIIQSSISVSGNLLQIKDQVFNLSGVEHVYIVGFGKPACLAVSALDEILGSRIKEGVAIGLEPVACEYITTYGGTHPHPSVKNVEVSEKIVELSKTVTDKDLVIVVVSGGGSALLCWPMKECEQANRLYKEFLKTGGNIKELNTIRKHISFLKGGGLAKELYPAQVIGLIFSDVPGNNYDYIASGPTYKDNSTVADAQAILDKYGLTGYELSETPTDDKYFERVINVPLVSNVEAAEAMKVKAENLGLKTKILSYELYDDFEVIAKKFEEAAETNCVLIAGGEPQSVITTDKGTGGRCQRLGLEMLPRLSSGDVFAAVASDGLDNSSAAGIIEDMTTKEKMIAKELDWDNYKHRWDSMGFFTELGQELLETGPTQANVSDLMILYRK